MGLPRAWPTQHNSGFVMPAQRTWYPSEVLSKHILLGHFVEVVIFHEDGHFDVGVMGGVEYREHVAND